MFDLKTYLTARQAEINNALQERLPADASASQRIWQAMTYSLMAGGKRIRPILCLAACEALSGDYAHAMVPAIAIEMIHTYSLIHDDLPAMDNDDLRRGNPTCHKKFDEATAILAGDALLTHAFYLLAGPEDLKPSEAATRLSLIRMIAKGSGIQGMIAGQMHDIEAEGKELDWKKLEQLHTLKTGALIEASVLSGALLGGAEGQAMEALSRYARNIGLAFQVADDILNVEGDPKIMGKAKGTDQGRNKSTYPSILGLEKSRKFAKELVDEAMMALDRFDEKAMPLLAIAGYVVKRQR
jgi:geranylgeranyl diphosphate synthase type II